MLDAITLTFLEGCGLAGTVSLVFCWAAQIVLRLSPFWISCVFVLFCCVFSCCFVVLKQQQKHCSFASCEAMDVNLNFPTSGAHWTWSTCPTITPSIYLVLCKIVF